MLFDGSVVGVQLMLAFCVVPFFFLLSKRPRDIFFTFFFSMLLTFPPFHHRKKKHNSSLHFRLAQSPTFTAAVVFTSLSLLPLLLFSCFFFLILQLSATRIGTHTHVYTKKKIKPTNWSVHAVEYSRAFFPPKQQQQQPQKKRCCFIGKRLSFCHFQTLPCPFSSFLAFFFLSTFFFVLIGTRGFSLQRCPHSFCFLFSPCPHTNE